MSALEWVRGFVKARPLLTLLAMYGVLFFAGVYFTIAERFTASESGIRLLFYLPGLGSMFPTIPQ
jgi:hypothetical protein